MSTRNNDRLFSYLDLAYDGRPTPFPHSMLRRVALLWALILTLLFLSGHSLQAQTTDKIQDRILQINKLYDQGQWEAGKALTLESLQQYKQDSDLTMLLGKYYLNQEEYREARFHLNKALTYDPENVETKQLLVNVETQTGRYSSAICYVNELLEVNPYWQGLWRRKIELYRLQGNLVESNRLLQRVNQIFPNDSLLQRAYQYQLEMQALESRRQGDLGKAQELSLKLLQENPNRAEHYLYATNDYLQAGDPYGALGFVERGLARFPQHEELILKKAGILAETRQYPELLEFLQHHGLQQQYRYYALQAARSARDQQPVTLYAKVLEQDPRNEEAFNFVFADAIRNSEHYTALQLIENRRSAVGNSRDLLERELVVYGHLESRDQEIRVARELLDTYGDAEARYAYASVMLKEAQDDMAAESYRQALVHWQEVRKHGSPELMLIALRSIHNVAVAIGDHSLALEALDEWTTMDPYNQDLYLKRAELYVHQKQYHLAFSTYQMAIGMSPEKEKELYRAGFSEMAVKVIQDLNQNYRYQDALDMVERWLEIDPGNAQALRYGVNLSHQMGNTPSMQQFGQQGTLYHPQEAFFHIKMAELHGKQADLPQLQVLYFDLLERVQNDRYHPDLHNALSDLTTTYGQALIKEGELEEALTRIDTALSYVPQDRPLRYIKGVVHEKLHQFDSAHYYQGFYEPSPLELPGFRRHLNYLQYRSHKNQIGLSHLRSRHGDEDRISSISGLEYIRFEGPNTYVARMHYTGRPAGKGVQVQAEWSRKWNDKTSTMLNAAWANEFFPQWVLNASMYRYLDLLGGIEVELGAGYRDLYPDPEQPLSSTDMYNLVVGATKEWDRFRLNSRLNLFYLEDQLLYNVSLDARHFLGSPTNYLSAVGSIGSSPDVSLVDYQLYNGFSVLNSMVGAGFGHLISSHVSASVLGTWYHYRTSPSSQEKTFRNLYNISFQLHVTF